MFVLVKLISYCFFISKQDHSKDSIETIALKIRYLEEEIEIRVESIKIELDQVHDQLKKELNNVKNDLIR